MTLCKANAREVLLLALIILFTLSMASPFYAGRIADHYKNARMVQLGDSAGGLAGPINTEMFQSWGTMEVVAQFAPYKSVDVKNANLVTFYVREGLANKSITFAQFNNSADRLQVFAFEIFGVTTPLSEILEKSYAQIRSEVPRFHTFTATGTLHVILTRPEFYTVAIERRRLRDGWQTWQAGKIRLTCRPVEFDRHCPHTGVCAIQ